MLTRLARGYTYDAPRRQGFLDNSVVVKENVNKIPSLKQPTGSNFADRVNSRQGFKRSDPRPRFVDVDLGNQLEATKQGLKVSLSEKTVKDIAGASKDVIAIESFLQSSQARTPEGIQLLLDAVKSLSAVEREQLNEAIGDSGDKIAIGILKQMNSVVPAPPAPPLTALPPTNQTDFTDAIDNLRNVSEEEEEEKLPDWVEDDFKKQSELKKAVNKMKTSRQEKKEELKDWVKILFKQDRQKKENKAQNLLRQGMRRRKKANEDKAQKELDDDLANFFENLKDEMTKGSIARDTKRVEGVTPSIATVENTPTNKKRKVEELSKALISNPVSSIISTTTPGETPTGQLKEIGDKKEVWAGQAKFWDKAKTKTIDDLTVNDKGKIVSKQASQSAKTRFDRASTALGPQFATPVKQRSKSVGARRSRRRRA
jgi:hypothetical protein